MLIQYEVLYLSPFNASREGEIGAYATQVISGHFPYTLSFST